MKRLKRNLNIRLRIEGSEKNKKRYLEVKVRWIPGGK